MNAKIPAFVVYVKGISTSIVLKTKHVKFSFIWYTLTELFRKPDNWRQIYKQKSSTYYTSNDCREEKIIMRYNKVAK